MKRVHKMISLYTCPTEGCPNFENPVYLFEAINPVLCGGCGAFADAVETDMQMPESESQNSTE
jgi:hypothetical protein